MKHLLLLVAVAVCACSARPAPPSADAQQRPFPDIGGRTVMLLPVQRVTPIVGIPESADTARQAAPLSTDALAMLDAELAFWLPTSAARTRWVLPDAVERAALGAPTLDVRPHELPVYDFLRARLESIGDPLYGDLRKLGILMDARIALLPIGAVWIPEQGGAGRVHMAVALIDTFGGSVVWYGVVAGTAGAPGDAATVASAAQALAQATGQ